MTGLGDPNAVVHFTVDGTPIAETATADGAGSWTFAPQGLADGSHTIVASETDSFGNTGTASLTFTLDRDAAESPTVAFADTNIGKAKAAAEGLTVSGLEGDENGTVTFSDGANSVQVAIANGAAASPTVDLTTLTDGPITASLSVSDAAGNSFTAGAGATLDRDAAESATVAFADATIVKAKATTEGFTVGGLETDDNGTVTFSDGTNSVQVTITNGAADAPTVDLTGLADGPITASLSVSDAAGNTFTASANATLDTALPTVTKPDISGAAQEGVTLQASATAGAGDSPVTYQWFSSADGYTKAIGSGATYQVQETDEGNQLEVIATTSNVNGVISASSTTTAVADAAPRVTTPVITGTAQEGVTLQASASAGQGDNNVTYQWFSSADGYKNAIASGASYQVLEGDEGYQIEVVATTTNDDGVTISASSTTGTVVDAAPTVTTPVITGTAQEGVTLQASASAGQGDNNVTYQWFSSKDGFASAIGSGASYQVKEGDEGNQLKVVATTTNDNGVSTSASSTTTAVADAAPTVTTPVITGTVQEGEGLGNRGAGRQRRHLPVVQLSRQFC